MSKPGEAPGDPLDPTPPQVDDPTFGGQSIKRNLIAGFLLQIANYAFPLVLLPYLTRTLGLTGFGAYVFAINLIGYCAILVEWGFTLGAGRQVARVRQDPAALADIFWTTLTARLILLIPAGIALVAVAYLSPGPGATPLVLMGAIALIGTAFTADWYFGGLERMALLTAVTFAARVVQLLGTFLLVHGPGDGAIAVGLWGGTTLLSALGTLWWARKLLPGGGMRFPARAALRQIVAERHFFLTRSAVIIYTGSAPVVLGFVAGPAAVGLYGGAERLAKAALAFVGQVSSVMFPRLNAIAANAPDQLVPMVRRIGLYQIGGMALATLGLVVLAEPIVWIMLGEQYGAAVPVLRCLALLPLLVGTNNLLGMQLMLPLGMQRQSFHITAISAIVFIALLLWLGRLYGAWGAAVAIDATELVVILLMVAVLRRERPVEWRQLVTGR